MDESPLNRNLQFLRGVGPQRAEHLARMGIRTVSDLLFTLPRDVLDLTRVTKIRDIVEDVACQVRGRVVDLDGRQTKKGGTLTGVAIECDGNYVRGLWFNQPWILQRFRHNDFVIFSGKPKRRAGRWEFGNPHVQWLDPDDSEANGGVLPRYRLTEGLKMHEMRRIVRNAVEEFAPLVADTLPADFRARNSLPGLPEALRLVHLPTTIENYRKGLHRVAYQDLLEFQLGIALRRRAWQRLSNAPVFPASSKVDARIRRLFPFPFTRGQDLAISEICTDLASGQAMHRLLQADVGAGKTVVAIYALLTAVAAGYQGGLMAPTEVLAQQHWATLERCLANSRVERLLLTGSLTPSERRQAHERIRNGQAQLIVGTQALIQKDVSFARLGLVVIDEQHRFGVRQRAQFAVDGMLPHTLVMTATPIPRSLCLTQFGDLELSVMRELPPGRQPVSTHRVPPEPNRAKAWDFIRKKIASGRQAYIVCPRIEGGAAVVDATPHAGDAVVRTEPAAAERVFAELQTGALRDVKLGLLHGQLSAEQKQATMQAFREGEIQALVCTTVIEVGVDVPNATLMVVYDAERFGLAQLHQLRGRVGRGQYQGYCFLFSG
ncbi:MAG: ATP-dependent DNA helicase RecG, partial [Planctomycetota bacterium]|nr:ATP-dependent DNA helicase RecG [Planctomycetota bacterium]